MLAILKRVKYAESIQWIHSNLIPGDGYCVRLEFLKDYNGTNDRTLNGLTCQRWDSQDPHRHRYNDSSWFPEGTFKNLENFCRTPDGSDWPWCFTTTSEVRSQPCDFDVKLCGGGSTSGTVTHVFYIILCYRSNYEISDKNKVNISIKYR